MSPGVNVVTLVSMYPVTYITALSHRCHSAAVCVMSLVTIEQVPILCH